MANDPDPPDKWRVYEGDATPDPEPAEAPPAPPPNVPYGGTPIVPYGAIQTFSSPITIRTSSAGPKLIVIMIAVAVLGGGVAAAVAIFAAANDGIGIQGISGVDPKDPGDFEEMVEAVEDKTGSTTVQQVGLYDGYAIIYLPFSSDPTDDRQIGYRWDGGGLEEWTKTTSTDPRFDLAEIDPQVIDGMCDPVLEEADGATSGDCYVFISKPHPGSAAWFSAGASDDFGKYYSVMYDKNGIEIPTP